MTKQPTIFERLNEKKIQNQIVTYLKEEGIFYVRVESTPVATYSYAVRTNSHKGFSDLMIVTKEKIFFIELKAKDGKLTAHQKAFILNIKRYSDSNYACVCCSLAGLKKILAGLPPSRTMQSIDFFD
jgi:hypothetical protein